jgi:O-antigen/teichoic acid export membrane protein
MADKRKNELAKNTAILTFGKICTQSISFFLLPLYTALLEPAEYGVVDLLTTYNVLILTFVNCQFDQGLFRFMLDDRKNLQRNRNIMSSMFFANVLQSLIFIGIFLLVIPFVTLKYKYFLLVDVVLSVFLALFMQFARGLGRNGDYAVSSFISAAGTVVFNVLFLVVFHMDGIGLLYSILLSKALAVIYLFFKEKAYSYISVKNISKSMIGSIAKYSLPLIPNNLAWWVVNASDRTIVTIFLGTAINGIYTVANKFSNIFINFYNILSLSWSESVSLHFNDKDRDKFLSTTMTTLFNLFAGACFCIIGAIPCVFNFFVNEKYAQAYPHIAILMIAMLFRVVVGLYSVVYIAQKKTMKIMITTVVSAVINLAVDFALINFVGLYAASLSTLIAFAVVAVHRYKDVNKQVHMVISLESLLLTLGACAVILPLYYWNNFYGNIVGVAVAVAYALVLNRRILKSIPDVVKKTLKIK